MNLKTLNRVKAFFKRKLSLPLGVSYIYLERLPAHVEIINGIEEEFDAETSVIPLPLTEEDFLDYESNTAGFDDEVLSFFDGMKSGYYRVKFETSTDQEFCDGYPVSPEYLVFSHFTEATPSPVLGRLIEFYAFRWRPSWNFMTDLIRPVWAVDIEYGGVGITTQRCWLLKAVFIRFVYAKPWAVWGPGWTRLELKRG